MIVGVGGEIMVVTFSPPSLVAIAAGQLRAGVGDHWPTRLNEKAVPGADMAVGESLFALPFTIPQKGDPKRGIWNTTCRKPLL